MIMSVPVKDTPRHRTPETINDFIYNSHQTSLKHGFWAGLEVSNTTVLLSKLMLITTEVAEAAEAIRKGDMANFAEELADICIRVFDVAGATGVDLESSIINKQKKNDKRKHMHGKLA